MTSERWEEINRIYDAALEVAEAERPGFVREACHGDEELRREVESLLAYDHHAQQFIDRSALEVTAEKLATEPPSLVGRKLGPYQILGVLGAGGMGEVYRARDTRLNRSVAIKVLPKHLSERADLRQRFEREARAIAGLDHPHICALYDIGHEGETHFLVMQYLRGETLSQRLRKGALTTAEVLRYATEIAAALDQAHRKGVVHRDLKPGNIMLTETGAKLLDFGLAKQNRPPLIRGDFRGVSGTESKSITEAGMILGTLEYMAPEQLEGKEADARTDIFALGVVMYEMATGRKAFEGDSKASLIAKILTFQPPAIQTVQPVSPTELDVVVKKCLAKKPEERSQTGSAVVSELQHVAETVLPRLKAEKRGQEPGSIAKPAPAEEKPSTRAAVPRPRSSFSGLMRSRLWQLALVGIVLAVIASLALRRIRQQPAKTLEKPMEMSFKPLTSYSSDEPVQSAAISPDGKYLALCMQGKLSIQVIRTGAKRPLALPEGFYPTGITWFPDSTQLLLSRFQERWIQVKGQPTRGADESRWSMSILGGKPQEIVTDTCGASISPDGSLLAFSRHDPEGQTTDIWLAGANGESPRRIRSSGPNEYYFIPVWSSTGQRLFYFHNGREIESCDLRGEKVATIFTWKGNQAVWGFSLDPQGRILFILLESHPGESLTADLWEIKVDLATGKPLSEARRLTQWSTFGSAQITDLSITADGKSLVVRKGHAQADVYVADLEPDGKSIKSPMRLTRSESDDAAPTWTTDSRAVLFHSNRNGTFDVFRQDINQTEPETLISGPENDEQPIVSPDGDFILYLASPKTRPDARRLMRIPVGGGPPELVLTGEKIRAFACAPEANVCVVAEEVAGKQSLTIFDPLKGRQEKLPDFLLDLSDLQGLATARLLSLQGQVIEKVKPGPQGLHVQVRSLTSKALEEVRFKDLIRDYKFSGWSSDGKGIYLEDHGPWDSYFRLLYAGLDGRTQVIWKRGISPGWTIHKPVPSPDGRHLAFTAITYEMNAWMLENF